MRFVLWTLWFEIRLTQASYYFDSHFVRTDKILCIIYRPHCLMHATSSILMADVYSKQRFFCFLLFSLSIIHMYWMKIYQTCILWKWSTRTRNTSYKFENFIFLQNPLFLIVHTVMFSSCIRYSTMRNSNWLKVQ